MELSEREWPQIKAFIDKNIDELANELHFQQMQVADIPEFKREGIAYKTKIENCRDRIKAIGLKLGEFNAAKDALLNFTIGQLRPFVDTDKEIAKYIANAQNDYVIEDLNN